jgi:predicted metal-dependent hydrolase
MALAAAMIYAYFERSVRYVCQQDPNLNISWWQLQRLRARDSELGLLPTYRNLFGRSTLAYFSPRYSPEDVGSTAQAVAYLATSPAARAAHV